MRRVQSEPHAHREDMRRYLASAQVPEIDYEASDKAGEIVYTGRMKDISPGARDFMMQAIEKTNRARNFSGYDPGAHLYILHNDEHRGRIEEE